MSVSPSTSGLAYEPQNIEPKWQLLWEKADLFQNTPAQLTATSTQKNTAGRPSQKLFHLFAFAYPSGSGLHVGHVESMTALDILSRFQRMQGKQVYFPVGWDAFGLPAENYAIKTGVPPAKTTHDAIKTFQTQIKRLGISYDWANEIATNHPEYYKWTQWLFLQLYQKGLAYKGVGMVNWCPSCQTVLANEQVVNGQCERCSTDVIQKELNQWYFKITAYQDELISGLETVDWPNATKQQQLNWIGKKAGINIAYQVIDRAGQPLDSGETITCFTTRPDTNFGATFLVLAPEHTFAKKVAAGELAAAGVTSDQAQKVAVYLDSAKKKTELERQQEGRQKSGVFTGAYAINQLNNRKLPVYISDFVLGNFGTGAVVGVPGHDLRDFEFATQFGIEIIRVVKGPDGDISPIIKPNQVQEDAGVMINSEFLDGLEIMAAKAKIMDHFEAKGWGQRVTTYKLRDWLISRQRYWGAPIPIVYDPEGQAHPVKPEHLPWRLPEDVGFKPTGESPLKSSQEFIARTEKLYGKGWRPEFDTMDTFVDSSWYYLRYCDSRNTQEFASSERMSAWLPADLYLIGPEHIVLHLLYSRFFTKFLRDEGYFKFSEPFQKMRHQGMILGPDGKKMSKSKGNVINPDSIIAEFGADTLRVYEMFMGPLEADKPWDTRAVAGVARFLKRWFKAVTQALATAPTANQKITQSQRKLHQTLKKITEDLTNLKFNTAIAALMEFLNVWEAAPKTDPGFTREELSQIIRLLAPLAPFMAEELWSQWLSAADLTPDSQAPFVHQQSWPEFNPDLAQAEQVTIMVQVNGKIRGQFAVATDQITADEVIKTTAQSLPEIQKWLVDMSGATLPIKKIIYVSGRLVSLVV
ncbi:MAG TPA: leucine--tRNA ligase [Candidatus Pacebacteria bacterium]|nr:leucine--tRNA ligase [Candidatus Paceibacterota bacterium]